MAQSVVSIVKRKKKKKKKLFIMKSLLIGSQELMWLDTGNKQVSARI